MKLICETCTINRAVSGGKRVFLKTILAIGKGSERKADETKIMLITTSNKTGTKYAVLHNISKIFTRFLEEGKATISFLAPEHDVQIKSDKIQLTAFLKVLKLVLTGTGRPGNGGEGNMLSTTTTTAMLAQPVALRLPCLTVDSKKASMLGSTSVLSTRCVIKHRKDYPSKGFSRLLVSLQISDIKLCRLDTQIMLLPQLRSLNLSNNCLEQLPRKFGQMRLTDLDLSGNNLQDSADGWQWLLEPNIQSTLQTLNISGNGLSFLPINLIYARALVTLMADNNHIRKIPFAVWKIHRLREFSLANNHITAVPETLRRMRLQRLDLSANELCEKEATVPDLRLPESITKIGQPSSLFELAARTVIQRKIPYWLPGSVPFTIVETLHRTPLCGCGQPCFESKVYERAKVISLNCKHIILNANHQLYADCVFCSQKCSRKV